jgi:hypothetical protein
MSAPSKTITAIVQDAQNGQDAAFLEIPFDVKAFYGSGRPKIHADFGNGVTYRGLLVKMGTPFHMLLMRKDIRAQLGVVVGDEVTVTLTLDTAPREVEIPEALGAFLKENPKLEEAFNAKSYTFRKEAALSISGAKREETVQRRLEKIENSLK